jgi:predicted nucleotidyltransferase
MDKASILEVLRTHEPELKAAGVVHLRLFGSVARGESSLQSDVDLMAELDRSKHPTLLTLVHLENRLTDILGIKADLALADAMRETVRLRASREAILAF